MADPEDAPEQDRRAVATEAPLLESFRAMAENVPGALFRYVMWPDGHSSVEYMSPRCTELWEVPAQAIQDDASLLWQMVDPADLPGMQVSVMASARTLHPWLHEWRITTPSGRLKWLEGRGRPLRRDDGSTLWNSLILDITERRHTEAALRHSEERLAHVLAVTGEGVWDWDLHTDTVHHNRRWCELLGLGDALLQHPVSDFFALIHPDDRSRVEESVRRCLDGGAPYRSEHRIHRTDGSLLWVHDRGDVVERSTDGRPLRMLGSFSDISERVLARQALQALNEGLEQRIAERTAELAEATAEAERANRAKSDFLAGMSHELRTPLNAVLGFGQLLQLEPALSARSQTYVHELLRGGRHLLELINEVLDLARVEAGRVRLSLEPVELQPLLDDCRALLAPLAAARQICWQMPEAAALAGLAVQADRMRLKQVLVNLLSNAIKYNREGGGLALRVDAVSPGELRLVVADSGIGIPPERLGELFQPFSRLGAEHSGVQGSGIGLVITQQLVALMGGRIEASSVDGQGSEFAVTLPAAESVAGPTAPEAPATAPGHLAGGPQTVLVVDDNPANLRLMAEMLGTLPDLHLLTAHSAGLALDLARAHRPTLVLQDLQLPDMHGFELLRRLRVEPGMAKTPVVAVSSLGTADDIARGRAAGFDDYVVKPVELGPLLLLVRRLLQAG